MKNQAKTLPGGHREGETSRVSSPASVSLRGGEGWRSRKLPRCRWCLSGVREGDAPEAMRFYLVFHLQNNIKTL